MSIFEKYVAYLKDNPEGYWFKRKLYGWGWTPARWPGWVTLAVFLVFILCVVSRVDSSSHSVSDTLYGVFVPVVISIVVLISICYWKGEKPGWQWGIPKTDLNKEEL